MIALLIVTLSLAGVGALLLVFLGDQLIAGTHQADPHAGVDFQARFEAEQRRASWTQGS